MYRFFSYVQLLSLFKFRNIFLCLCYFEGFQGTFSHFCMSVMPSCGKA